MFEPYFSRYLTHSAEDERWQMVCTDVGKNIVLPGSPYPPRREHHPEAFRSVSIGRRLNEYQLVHIPAGQGFLSVNGVSYGITAGSLFLLFPGVQHAYRPDVNTGWTELWVGFRGPHIDALCAAGVLDPSRPVFHLKQHVVLSRTFQSIFETVLRQAPLYQFQVCAQILSLLAETLSLTRLSDQPTRSPEIVERAKAYIETHVSDTADLNLLSAELAISVAALSRLFKDYTGMTPYQYWIHAKINRAKEILTLGDVSIKEIAWQIGVADPYYFSRLFKKKTGCCPSEWGDRHAHSPELVQSLAPNKASERP